jgi:hypothetical protein
MSYRITDRLEAGSLDQIGDGLKILSEAECNAVAGGMTNAETPWGQAFIRGFYKGLCGPPNGCGPWGYLGD